jgi:hypothetical protein
MGFLDKLKQQATDITTTVVEETQETAKMGQLQMQLRNLRGEEKDALEALGRAYHRLHSENRTDDTAELSGHVAAVNDVRSRITQKEAEIAEVRDTEAPSDGSTVESSAEEVVDASGTATAASPSGSASTGTAGESPTTPGSGSGAAEA